MCVCGGGGHELRAQPRSSHRLGVCSSTGPLNLRFVHIGPPVKLIHHINYKDDKTLSFITTLVMGLGQCGCKNFNVKDVLNLNA